MILKKKQTRRHVVIWNYVLGYANEASTPLALLRYQDMAAPRCGNGERRIIDYF